MATPTGRERLQPHNTVKRWRSAMVYATGSPKGSSSPRPRSGPASRPSSNERLPTRPGFPRAVWSYVLRDKKAREGSLRWILPRRIGNSAKSRTWASPLCARLHDRRARGMKSSSMTAAEPEPARHPRPEILRAHDSERSRRAAARSLRGGVRPRAVPVEPRGSLDRLLQHTATPRGAIINPGGLAHHSVVLPTPVADPPFPWLRYTSRDRRAREFRRKSYLTEVNRGAVHRQGVADTSWPYAGSSRRRRKTWISAGEIKRGMTSSSMAASIRSSSSSHQAGRAARRCA